MKLRTPAVATNVCNSSVFDLRMRIPAGSTTLTRCLATLVDQLLVRRGEFRDRGFAARQTRESRDADFSLVATNRGE
jgi:hypothetical protein